MNKKNLHPTQKKALALIKSKGGIIETNQAIHLGISRKTLYSLTEKNVLHRMKKGLYCLSKYASPDFSILFKMIPRGVLCLISALYIHELTTQIPHFIFLAIPRGYKPPPMKHLPMKYIHSPKESFETGVELHKIDDVEIRCYSKERTIADCFKHRNKIGLDVAIEALKMYWRKPGANISKLMHYARLSRVENIMNPYIEAVIDDST